ncbi:MAG: GH36-type glycosyl hydrolase domain-containing protein [Ignavibacteria bacterium]
MSLYKNKYGYFTDDYKEYVITNPFTPKPWINVISNGRYGLVISQLGGGFSWLDHSEFNRLNRWHQDLIQDNWGKYFYFKLNNGEIFSPTYLPIKTKLDSLDVIHGQGYTIFKSKFKSLETNLKVFVPFNDQIEIWDFTLKNYSSEKIMLDVFTYFEFCLGSSADFHREFHKAFIETKFIEELNAFTGRKRLWEIPIKNRGHWNIDYPYIGFITSSEKILEFDGDKEKFIGNYGSIEKPLAVQRGNLTNTEGKWYDAIGSVRIQIDIPANGEKKFYFILGLKENYEELKKVIQLYSTPETIEDKFTEVKSTWDKILSTLEIKTPDYSINLLVNRWLRYQAISGRLWARTAYYQQSGAYGFRDQLQDSLVFLPIEPEKTKYQILLHARHQFKNGGVLHWWHPITETGLPTDMTDDLLWLPFLVIQYLNETNDYSILNERVEYYDDKEVFDSILEHCLKAIDKVLSRFSPRGLPLIGAGDWNDGLSAVGLEWKGESIWLAEFLFLVLKEFSEILIRIGENEKSSQYLDRAEKLKLSFNEYAWDGEWFYRATKDSGEKIGSKENQEGKIYLNAQTWAVISGITSKEREDKALKSVEEILLQKNGPLLLYPAYSKPDPLIGYLSRYAPGRRENGGVYTHAATWSIWAFSIKRNKKIVYEIYKRLSPVLNGLNPDEYIAEPYVTPGNIEGPDSPLYGMGGWTWYTGSAAWLQKVIVDFLIGVRATNDGLLIDPCFPNEWESVKVKRLFRGKIYEIEFENPNRIYSEIEQILVNGEEFNNSLIPELNNQHNQIKVKLK